MATVEFCYDFVSPNAYLVHKVLPDIAARHGAEIRPVPVFLGGIMQETGNTPPMFAFSKIKGKLPYQQLEIDRFCERHGITLRWNKHFPMMTLAVMRGAVFAQGKPWEATYMDAMFDACWQGGADLADPTVIASILDKAGLPTNDIVAATQEPEIKQGLQANTAQAIERGAFGAPTMFLGDEMFFGKDALNDLEWRLSQG